MFVDESTFPEQLFVVTVALVKGQDYAWSYVVESSGSQEQAVERAQSFHRGGWDDVRCRRVAFETLGEFERFAHREACDRYKLEDWSSDGDEHYSDHDPF